MATREAYADGPHEDWRQFVTCSMCLEIYNSPKLLPCFHCFCQQCLQDLASRHGAGSFPCPQCRCDVTVPPGGVAAFQTNFHLNPKDLERARNEVLCFDHPKYCLDLYCVDCQQPVCSRCVLIDHKPHIIEDLSKAAYRATQQLKEDEERLRKAVFDMKDRVEAGMREQQSARDKKAAVEKVIRRKQAWLKSVVDRCCEESLDSLTKVSGDSDNRLTKELDCEREILDQLNQVWQQVKQAVSTGEGCRVVRVAKEMRKGWGSSEAMKQLTPSERGFVQRPVLNSKVTEGAITPLIRDFLGVVEEEKMDDTASEVEVVEKFRCGKDEENVEVFSLCPYDDGSQVVMSFARRGIREDAPSEKFDEKGKLISTQHKATGKRSWKSRGKGKDLLSKTSAEYFITFDKSQKETIFRIKNNISSGTTDIQTETVTSVTPLSTKVMKLFTISVGLHRGFAVDSSELHFVVLEEADPASGGQRKVRLYHRGHRDAMAMYRPPSGSCRPSDVCFWREPGGREILVVSDDGTDSLHAVNVQEKMLTFEGYLAPGNPLIVQPTALNTDTQGRLWVAMRGGQVVTVSGSTG